MVISRFKPIEKLTVFRRLTDGGRVILGEMAQNQRAVYFQYDSDYLTKFKNLSPFGLDDKPILQQAPRAPHYGVHGLFGDALPDGWGMLVMDRVFRQCDILPQQVTAMDRLAYVGSRGLGALEFEPTMHTTERDTEVVDVAELGLQAQALFDGHSEQVLKELAMAGGSGGARPKAQIYISPDDRIHVSTVAHPEWEPWIVKFTSGSLMLGHQEGLCEAAYLTLAGHAGIDIPEWMLLDAPELSGAKKWLALKRFDCAASGGRYHLHSLCGLLDADFREPSMDYEDLFKATSLLCQSPAAAQIQFRRAIFNLLTCNQDDHTKNWAFLLKEKEQWEPAPFFDVTFSPNPHGQHTMSYAGFGRLPSVKAMQRLAQHANYAWPEAKQIITEIKDVVATWPSVAQSFDIEMDTIEMIHGYHEDVRKSLDW